MLDLVSEPQEPTPELLSQNPQTGKSRFVTNVGDATNMGAGRTEILLPMASGGGSQRRVSGPGFSAVDR